MLELGCENATVGTNGLRMPSGSVSNELELIFAYILDDTFKAHKFRAKKNIERTKSIERIRKMVFAYVPEHSVS